MKLNKLIRPFLIIAVLIVLAPQQMLAQKLKVSCVGNSITYGGGLSDPSTQSYPPQLQTLLGTTSWSVGNFGISSRTMLKNGDYPYWKEQIFTDAKAYLPNYVTIELGTNDSKPWNWNNRGNEFVSNYKEMIQIFQNLSSKPEVWIGLIPPGDKPTWGFSMVLIRDSVNARIKQVALQSGVALIDMFDALGGNKVPWYSNYFQADSIHPTQAGEAVIAQKIKEMLLMPKPVVTFANGKVIAPAGADYQWYLNGSPIAADKGGKLKEFDVKESGRYKVSIKLITSNQTRIVSKELAVVGLLNGSYYLTAKSNQKNIALSSGQVAVSDTIKLFASDGSDKQNWGIASLNNGYYTIQNVFSKKYLSLGEDKAGAAVLQISTAATDSQMWSMIRTTDGYYQIQNKKNGLYLTVLNNSQTDGALMVVDNQAGTDNQLFAARKSGVAESPFSGTAISIPGVVEAEDFNTGGEGIAFHSPSLVNNTGFYRPEDGLPIDTLIGNNGYYVKGLLKDDWMKYTVNVTDTSKLNYEFKLLSSDIAKFHLEVDGVNKTGILDLLSSNSNWVSVNVSLKLAIGTHTIRFYVDEGALSIDKILVQKDYGGKFQISSAVSGKNLSVYSTSTIAGYRVAQYPQSNNTSQQWVVSYVSDGYYKIENVKSGLVMGVPSSSVVQQSYTGTATQLWRFVEKSGGYMNIVNKSNGLFLSNVTNDIYFILTTGSDNTFFLTQIPSQQLPWNNQSAHIPGVIEAENYDLGGESVAYHELDGVYTNGLYRKGDAVDIEAKTGGGYDVYSIKPGEWLNYSLVADSTANYNLEFQVSATANSALQLLVDGAIKDTLNVNSTGGSQTWTKNSLILSVAKGSHVLQLKSLSGAVSFDKVTAIYGKQTAVTELNNAQMKVYPNPVSDFIYVNTGNLLNSNYVITDLAGKMVLSGQILNGSGKINIARLSKGTHILSIGNEQVKVIKNK